MIIAKRNNSMNPWIDMLIVITGFSFMKAGLYLGGLNDPP